MKYKTILEEYDEDVTFVPENLEAFYRFLYARQEVWYNRFVAKLPQDQWTTDEILQKSRYTNVIRQLDRGTLWWFENVYEDITRKHKKPNQRKHNLIWRTCIYRILNKVETFEKVGLPSLKLFKSEHARNTWYDLIGNMIENGEKPWTAAHITLQSNLKSSRLDNLKEIVNRLVRTIDDLAENIMDCDKMEDAWKLVKGEYGFGPFISYEVVTDLSYCPWIEFDDNEWANAGPGAKPGIQLIFPQIKLQKDMLGAMELLRDYQTQFFEKYNIPWSDVCGDYDILSLRSIEHSLCEFRKFYSQQRGKGRARPKFSVISPNTLYEGG